MHSSSQGLLHLILLRNTLLQCDHLFWCHKQQCTGLNMVAAMVSGNMSWHLVGQPSAGSLVLLEKPKGRRLQPDESNRLTCKDFSTACFHQQLQGNAKEVLEPYFDKPNTADGDDHGNYESWCSGSPIWAGIRQQLWIEIIYWLVFSYRTFQSNTSTYSWGQANLFFISCQSVCMCLWVF